MAQSHKCKCVLLTQIHALIIGSCFASLFPSFAQLLWKICNLSRKGHAIFIDCKVHASQGVISFKRKLSMPQ